MTRIALLACAAAFAVAGCSTTGGDGVASASAKDWSAPVGEDGRVPFASTYAPYPGRPTALTGATIYDGRGSMIENGTVLFREGKVVAVGDAASLCDPFLAEGLRPALMSGCEAAKHLDLWLNGEEQSLRGYSRAMRQRWGDSMAWGRRIAQVFYRFPGVGYQLGVKRPTAPRRIAQILSGEMGYGDIAQRVIRRLLLQRS